MKPSKQKIEKRMKEVGDEISTKWGFKKSSGLVKKGDKYYSNGRLVGGPAPKMTKARQNALVNKINHGYAKAIKDKSDLGGN